MATDEDTIALDIRQTMFFGLNVFDRDGKKVGQVDTYDLEAGYMMVRTNPFADAELVIPFSAITNVDPRELFVAETKEEAHSKYINPPPRAVESYPDEGGRTVISIPSGYDGTPIVVGGADTALLAGHIAPGYEVYTSDDWLVGRVSKYDYPDVSSLVVAEQSRRRDITIPLALVEMVDPVKSAVLLAVSGDDLRRFQTAPDAVLKVHGSDST